MIDLNENTSALEKMAAAAEEEFRHKFSGYDLDTCLEKVELLLELGCPMPRVIVRELVERLRSCHRVKLNALAEIARRYQSERRSAE